MVSSSDNAKIIKFITLLVSALVANYNFFSIFTFPLHAVGIVHSCKQVVRKKQKCELSLIFMATNEATEVADGAHDVIIAKNVCANLGSGTPVAWHINWTLPPSFVTLSSTDNSGELRISGGTTTSKCPDCCMKKKT